MKVKIFISWSGPRSHHIAQALYNWIPRVIQDVKLWISSEDINKGAQWRSELFNELEGTNVGIFCLTPENLKSPWLLFEAGAISKALKESSVCTYLYDLEPTDVKEPLSSFQCTIVEKDDTLKLLKSINVLRGDDAIRDDILIDVFERYWDDFEKQLKKVPVVEKEIIREKRDSDDILREVLSVVRSLEKNQATSSTRDFIDSDRPNWRKMVEKWKSSDVIAKYQISVEGPYERIREIIEHLKLSHKAYGVENVLFDQGESKNLLIEFYIPGIDHVTTYNDMYEKLTTFYGDLTFKLIRKINGER